MLSGEIMELRIELEKAIELIKKETYFENEIIHVKLDDALNCILAKDIYAPIMQPPFSKSALDGYAFKYDDTIGASKEHPAHFKVIDTVYAGDFCEKVIQHGEAVNIMTGGRIPEGCDCVIRFEDTNDSHDLEIYQELKQWDNICLAGEDISQGALLIKKGERLDYVKLAILSGMGFDYIDIYRPLKIGLCVTGSEVVLPGNKRGKGQIFDNNMTLLSNRIKTLGPFEIVKSYVKDDPCECATVLKKLSDECDLIFTTGGVSVGKKDILHDTIALMKANKIFWRILLKPGTPTIFSIYQNTPILSLSGNPFASTAIFELLGRNLIAYMQKDDTLLLTIKKAKLLNGYAKKSKQRRFIRAIYQDGYVTIPEGMHSSNEIGSMIGCNALIDIPAKSPSLQVNDEVKVWLL